MTRPSNQGSNITNFIMRLCDEHLLVTSHYAFAEAHRNIIVKRPQWQEGLGAIMQNVTCTPDTQLSADIPLQEKDRPILGSAIAASCDYLLTGDKKDFGHLYGTKIGSVTVVSYTMLAAMMPLKNNT